MSLLLLEYCRSTRCPSLGGGVEMVRLIIYMWVLRFEYGNWMEV